MAGFGPAVAAAIGHAQPHLRPQATPSQCPCYAHENSTRAPPWIEGEATPTNLAPSPQIQEKGEQPSATATAGQLKVKPHRTTLPLHRRFGFIQLPHAPPLFFSELPCTSATHIKAHPISLLLPPSSTARHSALPNQADPSSGGGQDARQDGLGGDEPSSLVPGALPAAGGRQQPQLRGRRGDARLGVLRAEPVAGLARRGDHHQGGHLGALHARAQPHGVPPPLPLLRRPRLLLQPLLPRRRPPPQGQVGRPQGRAGGERVAGDRGHRGGGAARRRGPAPPHAQALQVLPHLCRWLRRALHLLRPRPLGRQPLPEAADRHEEHHVPELHHPGGHGRVAGAHGHGHHQRHRQVHLQEHRHLLRHPRHRRPLHALLLPAQPRRRRPQEVLPGPERAADGEREREGEQGAAVRQRADVDGAARRRQGRRRQGDPGAHGAADDGAVAGLRAGGAGEAPVHQGGGVQGGDEPLQAQQARLLGEGLQILMIRRPWLVDRLIE